MDTYNHTRTLRPTQRDTTTIATQWTSWANDQVQHDSDHSTVDALPERLHRSIPSDHTDRSSVSSISSPPPSVSLEPRKGQAIVPTKEQLDIILPETPLCFCHKPAHRAYTLEYGPILECNSLGTEPEDSTPELNRLQRRFICGFHVHELSWSTFCDRIRQGHTIYAEHPELRTCSLYNFTYCAMFRVTNSYSVHPPIALPQCFCHRPVSMRVHPRDGLQLVCKNAQIDGARKCSWVLKACDVAFPRPKFSLHTYVSHDDYIQQKQRTLEEIRKKESQSRETVEDEQQHKFDLLATLSASFTPSNTTLPDNTPNEVIDFDQLAIQEKERQRQRALVVPTCVMMAKKPKQPALLSSSSSSSTVSTSSSLAIQDPDYQSALVKENAELKQAIVNEQKIRKMALDEMKVERDKLKLQLSRAEILNYRIQSTKEEQAVLLRNCQEKIQQMELSVVDVMHEKVILQEKVLALMEEKENAPTKDPHCILCFTQPIEHCLIPCFHYGKLIPLLFSLCN
ncbi:hypothetical protein A0J61_08380 [Choanephora cucurbitarum]|uniref:Uncharacterized protein n=1 Tax=Choanephora cucurbitarum TaxID=101091 RepID=A0A1C7N374_9FUNG|nr:hypothetical protein A0J61_08380 [Choanephora cucurbitarum]